MTIGHYWRCDVCGDFTPRDYGEMDYVPKGWVRVTAHHQYEGEYEWHLCSKECVKAFMDQAAGRKIDINERSEKEE